MSSSNPNWTWSAEHRAYYRQEFRAGKWVTIWAPSEGSKRGSSPAHNSSHLTGNTGPRDHRSDSAASAGSQLSYAPIAYSNSYQAPSYSSSTSPTSQSYPVAQTPQASYGLQSLSPYASFHSPAQQTYPYTHQYPNPSLDLTTRLPAPLSYGASQPSPYIDTSGHAPSAPAQLQVPGHGQSGRGRGGIVTGTYTPGRQHYEELDPSFSVRPKGFFKEGKVFAILFTEPAGTTVTDYNTSISTVRFGQYVYTQIRRFIVVRANREFCYACPIFTYKGQGTLKPGVRPEEHAIAYTHGYDPEPLAGEAQMRMSPICIVAAENTAALQKASRIYFGIHHPIQYNVKVKDLGDVYSPQVPMLRGYWRLVDREATEQDSEVTAAAQENDENDEDDEEN